MYKHTKKVIVYLAILQFFFANFPSTFHLPFFFCHLLHYYRLQKMPFADFVYLKKNQITRCFAQFSFKVKSSWSQNQVMEYFPVYNLSDMLYRTHNTCIWNLNAQTWSMSKYLYQNTVHRYFHFSFKNIQSSVIQRICRRSTIIISCRTHQIISIASYSARRQSPSSLLLWILTNLHANVSLSLLFLCHVCFVYERKI